LLAAGFWQCSSFATHSVCVCAVLCVFQLEPNKPNFANTYRDFRQPEIYSCTF
jgi:hypothetical protein